jgi:hypothetical protein
MTAPAASMPSSPAATLSALRAVGGPERSRRLKARPSSPRRDTDPEALSRDELRSLAKAERKAASLDPAQSVGGRREIQDLARRHEVRIEAESLAARLAQTSALALCRGEEVKTESVRIATPLLDEHGARIVRRGQPLYRQEMVSRVRVVSRGGLQLAFERGDLDGGPVKAERLLETGKAYRWAYETASALSTPARNLAPISGRAPTRASAGPQDAVFAAGEMLRGFRQGLGERACAIVDRVCGLDLTLRATAMSLRSDPRTVRKALVEALSAATQNRESRRREEA